MKIIIYHRHIPHDFSILSKILPYDSRLSPMIFSISGGVFIYSPLFTILPCISMGKSSYPPLERHGLYIFPHDQVIYQFWPLRSNGTGRVHWEVHGYRAYLFRPKSCGHVGAISCTVDLSPVQVHHDSHVNTHTHTYIYIYIYNEGSPKPWVSMIIWSNKSMPWIQWNAKVVPKIWKSS